MLINVFRVYLSVLYVLKSDFDLSYNSQTLKTGKNSYVVYVTAKITGLQFKICVTFILKFRHNSR